MAQRFFIGELALTSSAFEFGGRIPDIHTGNGEDISPALSWSGAPAETKGYALVCHDPDAPLMDGFTHWVVYNLSADTTSLPEGAFDLVEGKNNVGDVGYMGPAPPPGHGTHRYYFWIYALDTDEQLDPGLTRRELMDRLADHVLEQARFVGTYSN
jgi:Raf kinase inhibitor-like YbhB/YbcL family protein